MDVRLGERPAGNLRATHAIELAFLWDWIETSPIPTLAGVNPPRDLGRAMRAFWASFARDGRPVAPGEPAWTPYRVPDRSVLWLGAERRMEAALDDAVRAFWFGA